MLFLAAIISSTKLFAMPKKQTPSTPLGNPTPGRLPEAPPEEITEIPLPPEEELDILPDEDEPVENTPYEEPPPGEGP